MKAISLWQPWASAISLGIKRIETRSWETDYRGPLAIHAAKRLEEAQARRLKAEGVPLPDFYPTGAIVAVCELATIVTARGIRNGDDALWPVLIPHPKGGNLSIAHGPYERRLGDYGDGRFAWVLRNVRALERPVQLRGRQGLFDVPDELIKE